MNQLSGGDNHGSLRDELTRSGGSAGSAFQGDASSFTSDSALSSSFDEEIALHWAAIQRMPTSKRLRSSLFDDYEGNDTTTKRKRVVDVTKLGSLERHLFIDNLIKQIELDNFRLLQKLRKRLDKVGIEFPKVEVRYKNLRIEAECEVVEGKPLPTLWNSFKRFVLDFSRLPGLRSEISRINIIDGISGVIKPGRMTLLLGPPGSGKTSLLKALSGNLEKSFKTGGEISYNGYKLHEFMPQKTSAYISQHDLHMSEMTVRETLNFSSYCQGVGSREEIMVELIRREKEAGILPDPDIDIYMKAISVKGRKAKLQTDYILKILGLDSCADTLVGDVMKRGISGGQKRRLTIGEMIIGPIKALFMDEISNGLDSSTTYQIIACLQHLAHITDATVLVSLLQPAPEVLDLFDDIILLSERKIVYHGPRENVLEFFESCGFRCPERKGTTNFLHEVISKNDQAQYWCLSKERYSYQSVSVLSEKFKESVYGRTLMEQLSLPLAKSTRHKGALIFDMYSLPRWTLFRLCFLREFLLMKRNAFIYVFKTVQLLILASIAITVFLRTRMEKIGLVTANYHMGSLFFSLAIFLVDGLPEGAATVARLAVFNKQRDSSFYPPWAYAIPSVILKVPLSILAAIIWTCLIYFSIGYSLDMWRFFRHLILLFAIHLTSLSMFRFLASITRTIVSSTAACSLALTFCFLFSGFIIPRPFMPNWLKWGFWVSPLTYGEIGLAIDEFSSSTWQKMLPTNSTIGKETLEMHGLNYDEYVFWISIGALFCFTLLFNIGFTLSLSFLKAPVSRAIISRKKFSPMDKFNGSNDLSEKSLHSVPSLGTKSRAGRMILPFQPLTVAFQDLQYSIDNPMAKKEQGFAHKKLQLLHNITGAFRPRVLTALMGVTGAGKTTLLDVLAGRKTTGIIKGDIRIGGYPKVQKTFARVLGYCEQIDIHSPNITVEESIIFSAWLRLHDQIHFKTKNDFVKEVLETVELDGIKDALVGNPGVTGLSMEQRKRLTIGVELVANPSIMFLDEPTTRLDARAAAIVMRAVKRVADTGRTIVCTIHQPSIEIFESFEEIILLKTGGRMIYCGPLGQHSTKVIEYFESIPGVPNITKNYNPATWLLGVTSSSFEAELGVDFSDTYEHSALCQRNKELVKTLSLPPSSSEGLDFSSRYSQNGWEQFKACLWKQHWSYWRSPAYNLRRIMIMLLLSLLYGGLFLNQGKIHNQQGLFSVLGSMYTAVIFCGVNNTASILPYITSERPVFYRERFAGMYSLWAYALAQVVVEIPYVFVQTIVFTSITYPMIGYHPSAYKVVWYCYMMFCTLLCYSCLGMMIVSITPNYPIAAILQSSFYTMFHLFTGFLIPPQQIPKWWIWLYYITPTSWSLRGLVASQYADIDEEIEVFGVTKTVSSFLREYYGFHHHQLPLIGVILFLFPISFATVYAYCLGNLKFQKR